MAFIVAQHFFGYAAQMERHLRGIALFTLLAPGAFALSGCLAKTALDVATLPVRAASKGVDLATTSQSEADEKRGRELRKREERLGKLERIYDEQLEDCRDGNRRACSEAQTTYAEIQMLLPTIPAGPDQPEDR